MTDNTQGGGRPRFGRIADAVKYSVRSRGRLYQLNAQHPGLFRKDGASTLVDFNALDKILSELPYATAASPSSSQVAAAEASVRSRKQHRRKRVTRAR